MLIQDSWLPPFIEFNDYDANWPAYEDAVYAKYLEDLGHGRLLFRGRPVALRVQPESYGKGYGFWHCIQEGSIESERTPEMQRCKRIGWIKAIIENCDEACVDCWEEDRGNHHDHLLWWREYYLIVLSERGTHKDGGPTVYLLKTAYPIEREHQRRKRRESRDAWLKSQRRH